MDTLTATNPTATAAADATEPAASAWMQLPLRAYLDGPDVPVTVTLVDSGVDAVVLRAAGTAKVELIRDGRIVEEAETILAAPVADPARQVELLRRALAVDVGARQEAARVAETGHIELANLRASASQTLAELRDYAIDRYREDDLTRDDLDTFLQRFDLESYEPRVRVEYTITGSFEVDSDNPREVEDDVDQNLRVDLDRIDDVVDYSDDADITVTSVSSVDE